MSLTIYTEEMSFELRSECARKFCAAHIAAEDAEVTMSTEGEKFACLCGSFESAVEKADEVRAEMRKCVAEERPEYSSRQVSGRVLYSWNALVDKAFPGKREIYSTRSKDVKKLLQDAVKAASRTEKKLEAAIAQAGSQRFTA